MKPNYLLVAVLYASVALATTNCGDRTTTGPAPAVMQASLTEGPARNKHSRPQGLVKCRKSKPDVALKWIEPDGGRIKVGPYVLTVPEGALPHGALISARIRAGQSVNVVEFQPEGLIFQRPATLSMSYSNCDVGDADSLRIAVVDDAYQILYYLPSTDSVSSQEITAEVPYFSNYAVAW